MGKTRQYVFVLWGRGFEEVPAALFVTELRTAGLRVQVVGVSGRDYTGSHGLALVTDLTLDQALSTARGACCVIAPCDALHIRLMENDPRVRDFLSQACGNNALFVTGTGTLADTQSPFQSVRPASLMSYAPQEDMNAFVKQVVDGLSHG